MARLHTVAALAGAAAICAAIPALAQSEAPVEQGPPNVPEFDPAFPGQTRAPAVDSGLVLAAEKIVPGLEHPWGLAVLPGGDLLVTERPGRLRAVQAGRLVEAPVAGLPEVHAVGQGGLLDVAAGPDFEQDRLIYWTYAKPLGAGTSATAAARGRLAEDYSEVTEVEDIFVQEPGSPSAKQYGSRILFGGDGDAFVTTGEHFTPEERVFAQDLDKTYGKVVRIGLDGSVPADNPFVDEEGALGAIWSYGHRNVQGADIHPLTGQLWTIEHGPQGGDELNKIAPGANYGWPVVSYGENYDGTPVGSGEPAADGMTQPRYYWDPVIAPGGMLFYEGAMFDWEGDLLIASLTPGAVVRLEMQGDTVTGEERLLTGQGRIRDLAIAPDGALLALTDADDGAVLRLTPEAGKTN
jgi:glucose/arabinose dehydrogenase